MRVSRPGRQFPGRGSAPLLMFVIRILFGDYSPPYGYNGKDRNGRILESAEGQSLRHTDRTPLPPDACRILRTAARCSQREAHPVRSSGIALLRRKCYIRITRRYQGPPERLSHLLNGDRGLHLRQTMSTHTSSDHITPPSHDT